MLELDAVTELEEPTDVELDMTPVLELELETGADEEDEDAPVLEL